MDGLECSEVLLSKLDFSMRLDAEYYQKWLQYFEKRVFEVKHEPMKELVSFLVGPFGSAYDTSNYVEHSDYRYIRGQDVKPFKLKDLDNRYMEKEDFIRLKKYEVHPGDLLVSVVGTLGNVAIVTDEVVPAIFSCKSTAIKTKSIDPYYLVAYLNCKYGHNLLLRKARGTVQKGINLDDLSTLDIPIFEDDFQLKIHDLIFNGLKFYTQSKALYKTAEEVLVRALCMKEYNPSTKAISVKHFKESFITNKRIDAEFYQPKYDDLFMHFHHLESLPEIQGVFILNDLVKIKKSIEPGSDAYSSNGIPFIRVSDLSSQEITQPEICLDVKESEYLELMPKKGTVLLSKDGSIGIAYALNEDLKAITSSAILHLTIKNRDKLLPNYLALLINSEFVKMQAERDSGGSILQHWRVDEIKQLKLPIASLEIQKEISDKIDESRRNRKHAQNLFSKAVHIIELAIENGVDSAITELSTKNA